jgi:hypothetical protein
MDTNMLVTFYETARGDRPVEEFIDRLSTKEAAKVLDARRRMEEVLAARR